MQVQVMDFTTTFGFGRFLVGRGAKNDMIYLPTSSGLMVSDNRGMSWRNYSQGLKPKPDGFFDLQEIRELDNRLLLSSSTGLFFAEPGANLKWQKLNINNVRKDSLNNSNFRAIDIQDDSILVSSSQGEIFALKFEQARTKQITIERNDYVLDIHRAALDFAGIPTGKNFRSYRNRARYRNLIPEVQAFVEKDTEDILAIETEGSDGFNSNTSSINTSSLF